MSVKKMSVNETIGKMTFNFKFHDEKRVVGKKIKRSKELRPNESHRQNEVHKKKNV